MRCGFGELNSSMVHREWLWNTCEAINSVTNSYQPNTDEEVCVWGEGDWGDLALLTGGIAPVLVLLAGVTLSDHTLRRQ